MIRKVAVLGFNASGEVDIWEATVEVTQQEFDLGDHLDKAMELADADDFDGKFSVDVEDEMPGLMERINELYGK